MASTDLPATLVQQIACNVLSVAAAAIPLEVVEHTKALIVDSIGCALAATRSPHLHGPRAFLHNSAETRTAP